MSNNEFRQAMRKSLVDRMEVLSRVLKEHPEINKTIKNAGLYGVLLKLDYLGEFISVEVNSKVGVGVLEVMLEDKMAFEVVTKDR